MCLWARDDQVLSLAPRLSCLTLLVSAQSYRGNVHFGLLLSSLDISSRYGHGRTDHLVGLGRIHGESFLLLISIHRPMRWQFGSEQVPRKPHICSALALQCLCDWWTEFFSRPSALVREMVSERQRLGCVRARARAAGRGEE